jgi:hypothetical protein
MDVGTACRTQAWESALKMQTPKLNQLVVVFRLTGPAPKKKMMDSIEAKIFDKSGIRTHAR